MLVTMVRCVCGSGEGKGDEVVYNLSYKVDSPSTPAVIARASAIRRTARREMTRPSLKERAPMNLRNEYFSSSSPYRPQREKSYI